MGGALAGHYCLGLTVTPRARLAATEAMRRTRRRSSLARDRRSLIALKAMTLQQITIAREAASQVSAGVMPHIRHRPAHSLVEVLGELDRGPFVAGDSVGAPVLNVGHPVDDNAGHVGE